MKRSKYVYFSIFLSVFLSMLFVIPSSLTRADSDITSNFSRNYSNRMFYSDSVYNNNFFAIRVYSVQPNTNYQISHSYSGFIKVGFLNSNYTGSTGSISLYNFFEINDSSFVVNSGDNAYMLINYHMTYSNQYSIIELTPEPSPEPSPEASPDPSPSVSPDPSPSVSPDPSPSVSPEPNVSPGVSPSPSPDPDEPILSGNFDTYFLLIIFILGAILIWSLGTRSPN